MSGAVGLVGRGLLGSALAERWEAAGFDVVAYDPAAASNAASVGEVVERCRRVAICLPDSGVTASILPELLALQAGALVVDMTTGEPDEMEGFGAALQAAGIGYVDATVGGSSAQVRRREAIVMAGASEEDFTAARDLLDAVAARVFHVGPCGHGARFKLVLNLVLGLNRAALAEGLGFAEKCGLDAALALEVLKASPAYSRAMDVKGRRMLERDYAPEARLRQHHKDVRLILAEGRRAGAHLPLSATHDALLGEAEARGLGELDNSAVRELF